MHFTEARNPQTLDQLWCLEHLPVFTVGRRTKSTDLPTDNSIPIVKTDRGGQITWHGPGQLVMYFMIDLRRRRLGVRELVRTIEGSVISLLDTWGISAQRREGAPGVYVDGKKIAALGLRVRKGACYHGLSLNVHPDLSAFSSIHPCGYTDLEVTSLEELLPNKALSCDDCSGPLVDILLQSLSYTERSTLHH